MINVISKNLPGSGLLLFHGFDVLPDLHQALVEQVVGLLLVFHLLVHCQRKLLLVLLLLLLVDAQGLPQRGDELPEVHVLVSLFLALFHFGLALALDGWKLRLVQSGANLVD
jgi:hypothetical protein